jgi:DNA-binding NtrC family response regulator
MNYEYVTASRRKEALFESEANVQSPSVMNNRLEALTVLSQSLLREVEALRDNTKSENEIISEVKDGKIDLEKEVQKFEVELIRCALVRTGGRQRRAAKLLNVKISTLNAKIKRYGIATSGLEFAMGKL